MQNIMTAAQRIALCGVLCAGLAACGDTLAEQSIIGAGAGAGTAAVLDGNVAVGALVGAAGNVAFCERFPDRC